MFKHTIVAEMLKASEQNPSINLAYLQDVKENRII